MDKILFVAPVYHYKPILAHALLEQTHQNWELLLLHDGPVGPIVEREVAYLNDFRIRLEATDVRHGKWGHPNRRRALARIAAGELPCDYYSVTNADNYLTPGFCSEHLKVLGRRRESVLTYCDCIHNYWGWKVREVSLQLGRIDCCCCVARAETAVVGWRGDHHSADWAWIADVARKYGEPRCLKIPGVLAMHN